ncbi:MAG: DUF4367 domain-containing protein [Thaumarchaeota archaeon]|nr:DUF4367 domain-containing protein [Nitrososphaerota archaeon]MCL5316858.1 DUF4367 domain-containing protein [Nitrososphaerota archaeon]
MIKSNLKIIGAIITITLAISIGFVASHQSYGFTRGNGELTLQAIYDLNRIGKNVTTSELQVSTGLRQPTYLPLGTSSPQIKLRDDNSIAVIIYTNPRINRIVGYQQEVQILILAMKDGTSFETFQTTVPKPTMTVIKDGKETIVEPKVYVLGANRTRLVSIAGTPGYGYDPVHTAEFNDFGRVQWWSKTSGIHYEILADLPLQELVRIAASIQYV